MPTSPKASTGFEANVVGGSRTIGRLYIAVRREDVEKQIVWVPALNISANVGPIATHPRLPDFNGRLSIVNAERLKREERQTLNF